MVVYAQVAIDVPLDTLFTYELREPELQSRARVGKRVLVAFRGRPASGFLVGLSHRRPAAAGERPLAAVTAVVDDEPLFGAADLKFYRRAAAYYQTPLGPALHAILPGGLRYRQRLVYRLTGRPLPAGRKGGNPAADRERLASRLAAAAKPLAAAELARGLALSPAAVQRLLDAGCRAGWVAKEVVRQPPAARERFETIYTFADREALLASLATSRFRPEVREALLAFCRGTASFSRSRFLELFPGRQAVLRRWRDKQWLRQQQVPRLRHLLPAGGDGRLRLPPRVELTARQEEACRQAAAVIGGGAFVPYLLHGVTGSGKTEIYLKLMAAARRQGLGIIYLVPEIALTIQLLERLVSEFGEQVAVLHSGLGAGERLSQWRRIRSGRASIVVGARSAVFAPLARLGLLIVDEEHEPSYKQEATFPYHGRDLALLRGQMAGCPVVMGTATPALVTYHHARQGRYRLLELPQRLGAKELPAVEIVDLNAMKKKLFSWDGFSPRLRERMAAVLAAGRQVMLFLNQRGFSRTVYCLDCGYMPSCRHCSVKLTYHRENQRLVCHYCGRQVPLPSRCPQCRQENFLPVGVGIQRLAAGLEEHFPGVKMVRLDRDTTRKKGELAARVDAFARGEYQVMLGTQMLAKGLNFTGVDLVGVVFADLSLNFPEFTAAERTFQLLTQVAGRAGRGERRGEVLIQTLMPRHYSIRFAARHDFAGFFARELELRRQLAFPPFSHLVLLRGQAAVEADIRDFLRQTAGDLREKIQARGWQRELQVLGPVPGAILRVKNRYRWYLLLRGRDRPRLHRLVGELRQRLRIPRRLSLFIDVDPLSFV